MIILLALHPYKYVKYLFKNQYLLYNYYGEDI